MHQTLFLLWSVSLVSLSASASVWETTRSWNEKTEAEYASWVTTHWKATIFSDPKSKYYGISTDCSDASYTMPAIFAYEKGLPFAIRDTTSIREKNIVSNAMTRWDSIADPKIRFKSFLNLVHQFGTTRSLVNDTYPIAIQRNQVLPGTIYLYTGNDDFMGHTLQLVDLNKYGLPRLMSSTMPRKVRELLDVWEYPNFIPTESTNTGKYSDGYRRFKKPNQLWIASISLPGFSLEQFKIAEQLKADEGAVNDAFERALAVEPEPVALRGQRMYKSVCTGTQQRVAVVAEALRHQSRIKGRCMTKSEYDSYSTPSRDYRLQRSFELLQRILDYPNWEDSEFPEKELIETIVYNDSSEVDYEKLEKACPLGNGLGAPPPGAKVNLSSFYMTLASPENIVTWDPNSSVEQRWGLAPYEDHCHSN